MCGGGLERRRSLMFWSQWALLDNHFAAEVGRLRV